MFETSLSHKKRCFAVHAASIEVDDFYLIRPVSIGEIPLSQGKSDCPTVGELEIQIKITITHALKQR